MKYPDAIRNIFDHGKIMCDKQIRGSCLLLDILHQVDCLCLNGHIQRRDAFVRNDELGVHDEGAGNAHALTLTAGELVGVALSVLRGKADLGKDLFHLFAALCLRFAQMVDIQTLADDVLTFLRGFRDAMGS